MSSFLSWLSDNLSFVVGTSLGVLGILVGLFTYWLSRRPKTVDYSVTASQDIVGVDSSQLGSKLLVSWMDSNGKVSELKKPRVRTIRIKNTGKVEISSEDFKEPLVVHVPDNESIVEASVIDASHPGIYNSGIINGNTKSGQSSSTTTFRPILLNAGDWMDVQLVTDVHDEAGAAPSGNNSDTGRIIVSSWIKGQSRRPRNYNEELEPLLRSVLPKLVRPKAKTIAIASTILLIAGSAIIASIEDVSIYWATLIILRYLLAFLLSMALMFAFAAAMVLVLTLPFHLVQRISVRVLQSYLDKRRVRGGRPE